MIFDNELISVNDFMNSIKNIVRLTNVKISNILKNNDKLNDFCLRKIQQYPNIFSSTTEVFWFIIKGLTFKKCKNCNKDLNFKQILHDFQFCSRKCSTNSESSKQKIKQTLIERYGVDAAIKSADVQAKMKSTMLKKYGVENASQADFIKDKKKKTLMEHYGVDNPLKSDTIKNKVKETSLIKYGVENASQSSVIKEKTKKTNLERYGNECALHSDKISKKVKETNLARYGVEYAIQSEIIKNKAKDSILQRYGVEHQMYLNEIKEKVRNSRLDSTYEKLSNRLKDIVIPLFSKEEYDGCGYYDTLYDWKCVKCGTIFKDHIYSHIPRCPTCYPIIGGSSKGEIELSEFCKQFYPNLIQHDKNLIKPYELDIVIPEIKLTIEFNGKYWHSIFKNAAAETYHLMKTELCEQLEYRLIHIWEDEWNNNKDKIKTKLEKILNNTEEFATNNKKLILDRCWYSKNTIINGFKLVEITEPELMKNNCYNCGKLIYRKIKEDIEK